MPTTEADVDRGFLLAEDQALKAKVSRLYVPGSSGDPQRVKVWYSSPSRERQAVFPYITLTLIDIVFASDRAHSAQITPINFWPSEYDSMEAYVTAHGMDEDASPGKVEAMWFHPYDLYYQVATHCRTPRHDRLLTSTLLSTNYLPLSGFGYLDVPADGSTRWLENMGFTPQHYLDAGGKWVHRQIHNVKISAHMPPEDPRFFNQVVEVHGALYGVDSGELLESWNHEEPV